MPEGIVDELESVDVHKYEREWNYRLQFLGDRFLIISAIVQTRELVPYRVVIELLEHVVVRLCEPLLDDHDPHKQV